MGDGSGGAKGRRSIKRLEIPSFAGPLFTSSQYFSMISDYVQCPHLRKRFVCKAEPSAAGADKKNASKPEDGKCGRAPSTRSRFCSKVREIFENPDLLDLFLNACEGAGKKMFGTIEVEIEFVNPKKKKNQWRDSGGGYAGGYLNICSSCFFKKSSICHAHAEMHKPRYRYFRILSARGNIIRMPARKRNMGTGLMGNSRVNANGNYDKGHLIAKQLGGPDCPFNLVPMSAAVNRARGEFRLMEEDIVSNLNPGTDDLPFKEGMMTISVEYDDDDIIPSSFYSFAESLRSSAASWTVCCPVYNYGRGGFFCPAHT